MGLEMPAHILCSVLHIECPCQNIHILCLPSCVNCSTLRYVCTGILCLSLCIGLCLLSCVHFSTIASREKEGLYAVLSDTFMKKAILCQSIDSLE